MYRAGHGRNFASEADIRMRLHLDVIVSFSRRTKGVLRMRRARIAGFVAALLLSAGMAWPAQAQGTTSATCWAAGSFQLSPGLGMADGPGTYSSGGETGSVSCSGTVLGHRVTGSGSFGVEGAYVGTCLADHGPGVLRLTVPTDAGPIRLSGNYMESSIGPIGHIEGTVSGALLAGTFFFGPMRGDCVTAPVTEAFLYAVVSLTG
jgi:hypothetical protein